MTYSNLFQIIDQFDLYPEMLEKEPREVVTEDYSSEEAELARVCEDEVIAE